MNIWIRIHIDPHHGEVGNATHQQLLHRGIHMAEVLKQHILWIPITYVSSRVFLGSLFTVLRVWKTSGWRWAQLHNLVSTTWLPNMDALWRREDNSLSSTWCDMFSLKNIAVHFGRPHDWGVDFVAWQALAAIFGDSHGESYVAHGCHGSRWWPRPQEQYLFNGCTVCLTTLALWHCSVVSFSYSTLVWDDDPWWRCIFRWVSPETTSCLALLKPRPKARPCMSSWWVWNISSNSIWILGLRKLEAQTHGDIAP